MNPTKRRVESDAQVGKRTVAVYETGLDGVDRVVFASAEPGVVSAVEAALTSRIARSPSPAIPEGGVQ